MISIFTGSRLVFSRKLVPAALIAGTACLGIFNSAHKASAELTVPGAQERNVTVIVSSLLRKEHLSKRQLDDEISQRAMKMFVEQLDPFKIFFMQADVNEFMKYRNSIDDFVKRGDTTVSYKIAQRFLKRVDQRLVKVDELVNLDHDFTLDETLETDIDTIQYARDAAELDERWRKRIKYELLVRKSDDEMTYEEAQAKVSKLYTSLGKRKHQMDADELLEMFLTSVSASFDPHSTYMSPSNLENFNINMRLNLDGIGAALSPEDGMTIVQKIIPGGAADKHGKMKPDDKIVSVGQGDTGEMVDVIDMKLNDVVKLIRGHAGTIVRLGVIPAGETAIEEYKITRARIELKDSEARGDVVELESPKQASSEIQTEGKHKVGVINLPSFYMDMNAARTGTTNFKSTTRDVGRILDDFKTKNVDVVVLDLRNNGGGSLTEAINLTGLFIDYGPVVQVKDADGRVQHYDDLDRGMKWSGPLVVVTNRFSASASEILAGAIRDYRRGIVVGDESTHGKGTVQSLLDLGQQLFNAPDPPNYGALKITMQQFYLPSGDSTQKRGVPANIVLPSMTSQFDRGEADLDYAIDFDQVDSAMFTKFDMITPEIIGELQSRSDVRRKSSEDFAKLLKKITRYREQKDRKYVTLNEEQFLKEREELDSEREEEKLIEDQMDPGNKPVIDRNFYFDEVLNVSLDYVELLEQRRLAKLN
jgi:carboxyl-terminal processing protease